MVKEKICLGCNYIADYLDKNAEAVLWINDYYRKKSKELHLYKEDVEQYIMPKFWQTKEDFCNAKDYCLKIYKTILGELAMQLDALHCTCFGIEGWDVILWHWLEGYIEAFYDKYIRIKDAAENYPNLYLQESDVWYIPRENAFDFLYNEVLHAQQYHDVYYFLYYNNTSAKTVEKKYEVVEYNLPKMSRHSEIEKGIKHVLARIMKRVICIKDVTLYLSTPYLAISKTLLEVLSLGRIRKLELWHGTMPPNVVSENMRRRLKRNVDYGDAFINLIYDCLWKHIPMEFVEDFHNYYKVYQQFNLKMAVKIIDSTNIYNDILFKIFVADALNHGGKLGLIQHGGNYCIEKYMQWWEFEIAYKYYTWGNGFIENNRGNMCAMPLPKTLTVKKRTRKNILFVGYRQRPYVAYFRNLYAMNWEEVYQREDIFFQKLQQESRKKMRVRCYPNDPWWARKDMLEQKFSWMQFDDNPNYYSSMSEAKLVVTSIIATTCVEAINCDIPTIILYNKEYFVPDENAVDILNELRRVQVLFDDPEKAAEFINKNEQRVDVWWNETERKTVVNKFKRMYASHGWFPKLRWIKEMIKESMTVN